MHAAKLSLGKVKKLVQKLPIFYETLKLISVSA